MNLERRTLLKFGTGLAAVALPTWMAACYAKGGRSSAWSDDQDWPGFSDEDNAIARAWRAAKKAGQPLLVLTIPVDDAGKHANGQAWGQVLNHGPAELLADLALCEVVCAELEVVRAAAPELPGLPAPGRGEPFALLIETAEPWATPVDVTVSPIPAAFRWGEKEKEAAYLEQVGARIDEIAAALRKVIAPDRGTLVRRASEAAAANGYDTIQLDATGALDDELRERAAQVPAMVRLALEEAPDRAPLTALLASLSVARLRLSPPDGARWARSSGCGTEVEGCDDGMRVACGMAYIPEISQRFLFFFKDA